MVGSIAVGVLGLSVFAKEDLWAPLLGGRLVAGPPDMPVLSLLGHGALALTVGGVIIPLGGLLAWAMQTAARRGVDARSGGNEGLEQNIAIAGLAALVIGRALWRWGAERKAPG